MSDCQHRWEMTDIRFGFVVFEKCFHCNRVRTYFTPEDLALLGDKYREGGHFWSRVENAQTFRFGLRCSKCGELEKYDDLMGLLFCTGCLPDCKIEARRTKLEAEGAHMILACGFLSELQSKPSQIAVRKLDKLAAYFNQRRDASRSAIAVVPFDLDEGFSRCKGEFLHDVGMLSEEPPAGRKPPFEF